jgi:hypothetical protein
LADDHEKRPSRRTVAGSSGHLVSDTGPRRRLTAGCMPRSDRVVRLSAES